MVDEEACEQERPSTHNERSQIHEPGDQPRPDCVPSRQTGNKDELYTRKHSSRMLAVSASCLGEGAGSLCGEAQYIMGNGHVGYLVDRQTQLKTLFSRNFVGGKESKISEFSQNDFHRNQ